MAKITTITNPLTGQPAQVDQLDHTAQQIDDAIARALPGGAIDIALSNKMGGIESAEYPGCYYRTVDGVVEWANPPMYEGVSVEYRTVERYTGKPVYCKLLSIAPSSFTGQTVQIPHGISNMDASISVDGYFTQAGGDVKRRLNASYYGGSSMNCQVMANINGVYFEIGEDYLQLIKNAISNIFVMLKYTKSTD